MTKHFLLFVISLLLAAALPAQQPCRAYACAIERAEAALTGKRFQEAFNYLESAEGYPDAKMEAIRALRKRLFAAVEQEKVEAQRAKAQTQNTLEQLAVEQEKTAAALAKADSALQKANKLVNAFYFYEGRFALAYGKSGPINQFYFIDKNGDDVDKLGRYDKAEQFDNLGYAKVEGHGQNSLLDTFGNIYFAAYTLAEMKPYVTALDLRSQSFDSFPSKALQYPRLKVLILRKEYGPTYHRIPLPSSIANLKDLRALYLINCQLDSLPPQIGELKSLDLLDLSGNQLTQIPPQIGDLKNLTKFDLTSNQLAKLPPQIGELKKLIKLDLGSNRLTELPHQIGELKNLTNLELTGNQLLQLPPQIGELKNLTSLHINDNNLSYLPPQIGELRELTELSLQRNQLTQLPSQIGELKHLISLDLYDNNLRQLPSQISELKQLNALFLGRTSLTHLPTQIGDLKNLKWLDLREANLSQLPAQIGELKKLTVLGLKGNRLSQLPEQIGGLQSLTQLDLSRNQLTVLPLEIGQLKNLTTLDLSENKLTALPPEIGQLKNLTDLNLSGNQLTALPPEIGQLKNLTKLNLRINQLTALPPEIGQLKKLANLELSSNLINISDLANLHGLLPVNYLRIMTNELFESQKYQDAYQMQKVAVGSGNSAGDWFDLSWYALFAQQPKEAIAAAQKTLALDPTKQKVETNLALGYLLDNQWPEAEKIYLKWKGKEFPGGSRLCDEYFLQDLDYLEAADITHPDFAKVRTMLQK